MDNHSGFEADESRLDKLKEKLYSRNAPDIRLRKREALVSSNAPARNDWAGSGYEGGTIPPEGAGEAQSGGILKKLFVAALIFFGFSAAVVGFVFLRGGNLLSGDNVDINVIGPLGTASGDSLSLEIVVGNKNRTTLEDADLVVNYPAGTRSANDINQEFPRYREMVGNIEPGSSVKRTVSAILFGEKDSMKQIKVSLEYRLPGSNALFVKEKIYDISISSSPVSVTVDHVSETTAGKEVEFVYTLRSNSQKVLSNLLLTAEYPLVGFKFRSATPAPDFGTTIWKIGALEPGGTRTFKIKGVVDGEDGEVRSFRFNVGVKNAVSDKTMGITFISYPASVSIKRPFMSLALSIEGRSDLREYAVNPGTPVSLNLAWLNNLPVDITDAEIKVNMTGFDSVFKESSLGSSGYYRSVDKTIVWNKTVSEKYASVGPGQTGTESINFTVLPFQSSLRPLPKNREMNISVSVRAKRLSESNVPEEIESSVVKTIRVNTDYRFAGAALYKTGPFENRGPIPPKANQATTYAVRLNISNSANDLKNARVTGKLPPSVKWISGSDSSVTYDQITNTVTWNAGFVPAGTGIGSKPAEAFFQAELVPSVSEVGSAAPLLTGIVYTGLDAFTNASFSGSAPDITTQLTGDGDSGYADGIVIQ